SGALFCAYFLIFISTYWCSIACLFTRAPSMYLPDEYLTLYGFILCGEINFLIYTAPNNTMIVTTLIMTIFRHLFFDFNFIFYQYQLLAFILYKVI
ncbi:MAG: hypothetical protein K2P99_02865, partial [Burkholderiales bacterium]|nr:hypothetical protein [Burkholderiales bacterium]